MKFPDYVPDAVQQYITMLVEGDGNDNRGWAAIANEPGNEWIAPIVAFLRRFEKKDESIKEMFSYLDKANLSDASKKQFLNCAWAALTDYTKYRAAKNKAEKLNQDIAAKAEELAGLLDDIQGHGLSDVPIEFYDVRTLLHETDNRRDLTWWCANRNNLTGKSAGENALYAWGIAPSLADLLGTVAKAARNYEPSFYGRIGAAISKGQLSLRTEFIRAFGHELIQAGIPLTESSVLPSMTVNVRSRSKSTPARAVAYSVRKAMAALATVALGETIREREVVQQFPDIKPLTRPQQNTQVIRFD